MPFYLLTLTNHLDAYFKTRGVRHYLHTQEYIRDQIERDRPGSSAERIRLSFCPKLSARDYYYGVEHLTTDGVSGAQVWTSRKSVTQLQRQILRYSTVFHVDTVQGQLIHEKIGGDLSHYTVIEIDEKTGKRTLTRLDKWTK